MIESHVTSLVLSKKLKKLGFPKESLFYWVRMDDDDDYEIELKGSYSWGVDSDRYQETIPAFISSELGNMIMVIAARWSHDLLGPFGSTPRAAMNGLEGCMIHLFDDCKSEADFRANILIRMSEVGEIRPEDL